MHFYRFHVGDYRSHTVGLSPTEDLAYRRILDDYYMSETPPTGSPQMIARRIGLPNDSDAVRWVLEEYFEPDGDYWRQKRVDQEIAGYASLREKGRKAARKRWDDAEMGNPLGSQCAGNTDAILTSNQEPVTNNQSEKNGANARAFRPPSVDEVRAYCAEKGYQMDPESFCNFYESKGWMVGKTKMKKWKAAAANWEKRDHEENRRHAGHAQHTRRLSEVDRVREATRRAEAERQGPIVATVERDD